MQTHALNTVSQHLSGLKTAQQYFSGETCNTYVAFQGCVTVLATTASRAAKALHKAAQRLPTAALLRRSANTTNWMTLFVEHLQIN